MILTDEEIARLIAMPKVVSNPRARQKIQKKSMRINYTALADGALFEIYVRQNQLVASAFSCGLIYQSQSGERVTLMRCNGSDHPHGNPLEGVSTIGVCCHIHMATQRYMEIGRKAEHYAEPTDAYSDVTGALLTLMERCNITGLETRVPSPDQNDLFSACDDQP
ncbi:DUF6978 family protein [Kerstersia gyiorum]|uniref:DUF6978 family protein n=1 Tax=Kerstersia gyiorum TaxID=206506 RepID=UPI0039ED3903